MITLDCKYNQVKVFADELERSAEKQLRAMCEQPFMAGGRIRIMESILRNIQETVKLEKIIRPIYNFKESERSETR